MLRARANIIGRMDMLFPFLFMRSVFPGRCRGSQILPVGGIRHSPLRLKGSEAYGKRL
ncbi:hypothetical protein EV131_12834 [Rhizobium laguerreae]|uniref:Uncharacterized protein n=1 Tax=Rhizobium laguerreae TaxID=1076926 RepID=A0AAX2QC52_9HYPH|nr:hypothetical protein EV131_12834 [Rhizobium laguerreae]